MTPNFFSLTWTSFGPALGNHLWQSTLFAVIIWVITLLWRKNQPRAHYWLWMAASIKFLVPFSLLIALGSRLAPPRVVAETKTGFYWVMDQVSQPFTQAATHSRATPAIVTPSGMSILPPVLVAVWLCGLMVVLLVWFLRWRRISSLMWNATPLRAGREVELLHRLETIAGTKKPIPIRLSHASLEPGVFGIFHPVLLWPEGISERLGDEHLEAILAHELWHVRRRDNLAAALHMVVEAIFWFHPLVWWMGARLVEERERACDQEVLALGSRRQVYAESILKTCEFCVEAPLACVSGVTGADLKKRIVQIMTQRMGEKLSFGRKLLLAMIAIIAVAAPIVFGLLHAPQVQAQSPQTDTAVALSYEVASIKPSHAQDGLVRFRMSPDGFTVEGATVKFLIGMAYNVREFQVSGGPGWVETERFDIDAKMPEAAIEALKKLPLDKRQEQRRFMLQSLLAERFNLKLTHSFKELPIYALVVAKNGPKFSPSTAPPGPGGMARQRFQNSAGDLKLTAMPISGLSDFLSMRLGRKVVDKTDLKGNYDLNMHFAPSSLEGNAPESGDPPPDSSEPSIFTAVQEQLGLKLESQKGPVETLIIDSAEKPSQN